MVLEVECLHKAAANVFLKTLEEPPPNTFLILTSTRYYEVFPTIRSRSIPMHFAHILPASTSASWLNWKQQYLEWLVALNSDQSSNKPLLGAYALLEGFEKALKEAAQEPINALKAEELAEEEAAGHAAGSERLTFYIFIQETIELTSKMLFKHTDFLKATRLMDVLLIHLKDLMLLKDANLGNVAFVESFLLQIVQLMKPVA